MSGRRSTDAEQWDEARLWIARADDDLAAARLCIASDPQLVDPAAFHCQQCAEKLLKGLLVVGRVVPPKTHDLDILATLVRPTFPKLDEALSKLLALTSWYISARYPDIAGQQGPTAREVRSAIRDVERFRTAIREADPLTPKRP
jgi:HEPN domain-containing protein